MRTARLVLIVALLVALLLLTGCTDPDVPPAGEVWFGRSFDNRTFEIHDRLTEVTIGDEFALVASFSRSTEGSIRIEINTEEQSLYSGTVTLTKPIRFYGTTARPSADISTVEQLVLRFIDPSGGLLAQGELQVNPPTVTE